MAAAPVPCTSTMSRASASSSVSPEIVMALGALPAARPRAEFRFGATRSERPRELFGARCDDRRVGSFASRDRCPTAFFDDRALVPRGGLGELGQFYRSLGLLPEFLDADWRQDRDDRRLSSLVRHPLGAAAERPSKLRETNHRDGNSTSDGAPDCRLYARIFIHATCLGVGRRRLLDPLPQNHGLEGEFACYPTRDLGRRRINHTRFRGTEFCAADQFFAEFYMVIFRNDYKYVYDYPELFARKALIPGS